MQAIAAAREDMLLRELIEWTELREMCLQAGARAAEPGLMLRAAAFPGLDAAVSRSTER